MYFSIQKLTYLLLWTNYYSQLLYWKIKIITIIITIILKKLAWHSTDISYDYELSVWHYRVPHVVGKCTMRVVLPRDHLFFETTLETGAFMPGHKNPLKGYLSKILILISLFMDLLPCKLIHEYIKLYMYIVTAIETFKNFRLRIHVYDTNVASCFLIQ